MNPHGPKLAPPEEKLLRLIRGPQAATPNPATAQAPTAQGSARRWVVAWKPPTWWLIGINAVLGCVLLGELIVMILVATKPLPDISISLPAAAPSNQVPAEAPAQPPSLRAVAMQPLFEQTTTSLAADGSAGSRPMSTDAKTLAARLALIGIVEGNPAQAIIEDAQTKKTFFVSAGQSVIEGLVVEDIRDNRVVLDLHGEKIELSL